MITFKYNKHVNLSVSSTVKIRKDLNTNIKSNSGIVTSMLYYKGKTATIVSKTGSVFKLDIDDGRWSWDKIMFEKCKLE